MILYRFVPAIIMGFASLTAHAGVYTWKDANGKIHYGDNPPAEKQSTSRQISAPPPVDDSAQKALAEQKMLEREKQLKTEEKGKATKEDPAQAKLRASYCQEAKGNLAAIESGEVRYGIDSKGERFALDGQSRESELNKARKAVTDWCSPPKPAAK